MPPKIKPKTKEEEQQDLQESRKRALETSIAKYEEIKHAIATTGCSLPFRIKLTVDCGKPFVHGFNASASTEWEYSQIKPKVPTKSPYCADYFDYIDMYIGDALVFEGEPSLIQITKWRDVGYNQYDPEDHSHARFEAKFQMSLTVDFSYDVPLSDVLLEKGIIYAITKNKTVDVTVVYYYHGAESQRKIVSLHLPKKEYFFYNKTKLEDKLGFGFSDASNLKKAVKKYV